VNNGKLNIWTVVTLIVSIIFFASGFIFGLIKESAAKEVIQMRITIQSNTARIDILERQYAVTNNELRHINDKLDLIAENMKEYTAK
jgi:hypothetical protein